MRPEDLRELTYAELDELAGEIRDFIVAGGRRDRRPPRLQPRRGRADAGPAPGVRLADATPSCGTPATRPTSTRSSPGASDGFAAAAPGRRAVRLPEPRGEPSTTSSRTATPRRSSRYAYGLAVARDAGVDRDRHIVAVIGDGSMTGGMAYEALNNLGHSGRRVIIVLNDNGRSYAPTVSNLLGRRASTAASACNPRTDSCDAPASASTRRRASQRARAARVPSSAAGREGRRGVQGRGARVAAAAGVLRGARRALRRPDRRPRHRRRSSTALRNAVELSTRARSSSTSSPRRAAATRRPRTTTRSTSTTRRCSTR